MAGTSRKTGSRIRASFARLAAIGVIAALGLVFTPGTASAAPGVSPIVDCYRDNGDGTVWVVLGYKNTTGSSTTISYGSANQFYPSRLHGQQPEQFAAGTVHGAFTVRLAYHEVADARWALNGTTLRYSHNAQYATVCPPTTQLPADGNGTGTAVALGAAGVIGAGVLYRFRRRVAALGDGRTSAGAA